MRCLDVGRELGFAALKAPSHTKFSIFLFRTCGCSGRICTGAVFFTSVGIPGGCQIANRWVSTIVSVGMMVEGRVVRDVKGGGMTREVTESRDQKGG